MIINKKYNIKCCVFLITKSYLFDDVDFFIDHYLNYCGFDYIYILDQESVCGNLKEKFKDKENVTIDYCSDIEKNKIKWFQSIRTTGFLNTHKNYDYCFLVDDDEYLWINKQKYKNIKEFLVFLKHNNIKQYAIPWRMISYKSDERPYDRKQPLVKDCFYLEKESIPSKNVPFKTLINPVYVSSNEKYNMTHYIRDIDICYSYNKHISNSFIIPEIDYYYEDLILYHYRYKSYKEFNMNLLRCDISNTTHSVKDTKLLYDGQRYFNEINDYEIYLNTFNIAL